MAVVRTALTQVVLVDRRKLNACGTQGHVAIGTEVAQLLLVQVATIQFDARRPFFLLEVAETLVELLFVVCMLYFARFAQQQEVTGEAAVVSVLLHVGLFALAANVAQTFLAQSGLLLLFEHRKHLTQRLLCAIIGRWRVNFSIQLLTDLLAFSNFLPVLPMFLPN